MKVLAAFLHLFLVSFLLVATPPVTLRAQSKQVDNPAIYPAHTPPNGKGGIPWVRLKDEVVGAGTAGPSPIFYHGGPVALGTTHFYYIWYGNWSSSDRTVNILSDFANSFGGSLYFSMNTTYWNFFGQDVPNSLSFGGSFYDHYSHGSALSDGDTYDIVMAKHAADPYDLYVVLPSSDVAQSGSSGRFGVKYCGWHNHTFVFFSSSASDMALSGVLGMA